MALGKKKRERVKLVEFALEIVKTEEITPSLAKPL
jgi:hypothetical protein